MLAAVGLLCGLVMACGSPPTTPDGAADSPQSRWQQTPAMPSRRLEPGVAALGTKLVVVGGFDTSVPEGLHVTTAVDVFDTTTQAWIAPLPAAPLALTHINLAVVGGALYLLGGLEGVTFAARGESWVLDPGATSWRSIAPIPSGFERGAAGVVATATEIYLLGGASTTAPLASCLAYEIASDTWRELPALPAPRSHPAAMQLSDGTLLVVGGLATLDSTQPFGDVLALVPSATMWRAQAATLSRARGGCAYGVIEQQLLCAGGEAGNVAVRVTDSYDPVRDQWSAVEPLPEPRAGLQGATIDGRFYAVGGAPALVYLPVDTVYVYTP